MKIMKGFTLIELMIAMVLGLFVVGATITLYIMTASGSSDTLQSARLNHDLELAMGLIVNDLRRTGYWGGAVAGEDASLNPFMTSNATRPNAIDTGGTSAKECILYSYDADGDDAVDGDEYYGFKLDSGTIRMRLTGTTTNSADCSDGSWNLSEIIDGDEINITALTFTPIYACLNITTPASTIQATASECTTAGDSVIELRQVAVSLTGEIIGDTSVTKTITETVILRNNRIL